VQELTDNQPKKSVANIGLEQLDRIDLRERIGRIVERTESDPEKRATDTENLRKLLRSWRNMGGFSPWWPLGFAAVCIVAAILVGRLIISHNSFSYGNPSGAPGGDTVRILKRFDAKHFRMYSVQQATTFHITSCQAEPLSAGQTLIYFAYQEVSGCADDVRFLLQRGSDGSPTLAPNCHFGQTTVVCEPNEMEARF